jgi:hypothetical protein
MTLPEMCSQDEEDEMSCLPLKMHRVKTIILATAIMLGSLPLVGCDNPGTMAPIAGRRAADPVQKVRRGIDPSKLKNPSASPGEPGKLPPGRGRAMD